MSTGSAPRAQRVVRIGGGSLLPLSGEEGRAFLQGRIALFGLLGAGLALSFYFLLRLVGALGPVGSWRAWFDTDGLIHLGSAGVLASVWLACRRGRLPRPALAAVDMGGAFLACLGASLPVVLPDARAEYEARMLLAVTNALIARAAVVPTPAGWTLAVSALAVLPAVACGTAYHFAPGRHETPFGALFGSVLGLLWCGLAVAIATLTSRVIYGLRQQVEEARQLGQYTLEEKIGAGGMGEVYRARHALLRRPTAVKLLLPGHGGETALARFEREVQLTSILTHPNTVHVYDYGRTPQGTFYYAMEFLDGVDLEELVRADGPQPPGRVVHVLRQVCGSLAEAHGIGLIHRDVKPANIVLCQRGGVSDFVKVLDFGLVRETGAVDAGLTSDRTLLGTPFFMSPEAIREGGSVDARSDLYALGAVAYYLLTGSHVFEGVSVVEVCSHHLHTPAVPPSRRLGRALPEALEQAVLACLEKDPAARPQDAQELAARLSGLVDAAWDEERARDWWDRWRARRGPSERKAV